MGKKGLGRYLTPLGVWALSFGAAVGWGAFMMPGTTFLPVAGPLGTALGVGAGALAMLIIGVNYRCLMKRYPDAGGAYSYVKKVCNYDHGFLCAWFLILTYSAIVWANATAFSVIGRKILGGVLAVGPHYAVAGYEVYLAEVALSIFVLLAIGALLLGEKRLAARVQTFMAMMLCGGVAIALVAALADGGGPAMLEPPCPPSGAGGDIFALQVLSIFALAPWAYVGFEAVSHFVEEFKFNSRHIFAILLSAVLAAAFAYVALTFVAASAQPEGCANWLDYVRSLGEREGVESMPVFFAGRKALGSAGIAVLGLAALAAVVTGIVAHLLAASRLVFSLARDGLLPGWFGAVNSHGSPRNAIVFLLAVSSLMPFLGRTAIGWIVDVTTIGACIAYAYVSYCAFRVSSNARNHLGAACGIVGTAVSLAFIFYFLVPNFWAVDVFAEESYFMLAGWCILGFVCFRGIFSRDREHRLGKSTVVWLALLFLIFFSSHMWVRQITHRLTSSVIVRVGEHFRPELATMPESSGDADETFLASQRSLIDGALSRDNLIQMSLVVAALGIMFSVYSTMARREREAAKAKEYFFSTVSHDIRTPLNAIIGYSQMMKLGFKTDEEHRQAVDSILISSETLLRLINDILDLSALEAGKMSIAPEPTDCGRLVDEIATSFKVAARKNDVELRTRVEPMPLLLLDPFRLRQIVFNLVGNAIKFTEKGHVEIRAHFVQEKESPLGTFYLEVEDTGVGISEEDQAKIAAPYVQLRSKLARHGGTGLGLAICKQLVQALGGTIALKSQLGVGSTFYIEIPRIRTKAPDAAPVAPTAAPAAAPEAASAPAEPVAKANARLLLVDDSKMNLMVLGALLKRLGPFEVETAADGRQALERLEDQSRKPFDVVLTDMWMPELDGEGLVAAVRKHPQLSSLPVYVITADVELQKNYAEKGFNGILLKPVTLDLLKSSCHDLFEA